ncbi:MAG: ABC transporter ATP-binding protein [Thermotogae bacterium]|jgi:oligopeptide/dipeptide ABC transporter ATP-binding protein|nr:ABC transporter ATP-binding protein [Thermotogota bacterium]MCL5032833.1 ABC transporter ATP-binding protein [Thermotogota bacterium]
MPDNEVVIKVENLNKFFPMKKSVFSRAKHFLHAVDEINFEIRKGKVLSLVGESGCGKTTTGKTLLKLYEPTNGKIIFLGRDVTHLLNTDDKKWFHSKTQMIFQDPFESLNPRKTIFDIVAEPMNIQNFGTLRKRELMVMEILKRVGISPPDAFLWRYPHELSGGQRQRVAIARALVMKPEFVVADEPTSMLDVSIRTQVMKLMMELIKEMNMSFLYITHDLAVARYMADEISVMYLGRMVEHADSEELINNPFHPYTKALISAVPVPDPEFKRKFVEIRGGIGKPIDPLPRCRFYDRCPFAMEICSQKEPELIEVGENHKVACFLYNHERR